MGRLDDGKCGSRVFCKVVGWVMGDGGFLLICFWFGLCFVFGFIFFVVLNVCWKYRGGRVEFLCLGGRFVVEIMVLVVD